MIHSSNFGMKFDVWLALIGARVLLLDVQYMCTLSLGLEKLCRYTGD